MHLEAPAEEGDLEAGDALLASPLGAGPSPSDLPLRLGLGSCSGALWPFGDAPPGLSGDALPGLPEGLRAGATEGLRPPYPGGASSSPSPGDAAGWGRGGGPGRISSTFGLPDLRLTFQMVSFLGMH